MTPDAEPSTPVPPLPASASVRSGVDVVSIDRIADLLAEFGDSFRERAFTPAERRYCEGRGDPPQHYAARWAAKEAFVKAVVPAAPPVPFRAIGVRRDADGTELAPTGTAETALDATADTEGWREADAAVSLSHDRPADCAVGQVVLVGVTER
ncbi:MAG: holo-ACP synthase [Haloferacaceae archaeon]